MNVLSEKDRSLLSELRQITEASESDGFTTGLQEINCNYIGFHYEIHIIQQLYGSIELCFETMNCETNSDHCYLRICSCYYPKKDFRTTFLKKVSFLGYGCLSTDTDTALNIKSGSAQKLKVSSHIHWRCCCVKITFLIN